MNKVIFVKVQTKCINKLVFLNIHNFSYSKLRVDNLLGVQILLNCIRIWKTSDFTERFSYFSCIWSVHTHFCTDVADDRSWHPCSMFVLLAYPLPSWVDTCLCFVHWNLLMWRFLSIQGSFSSCISEFGHSN